MRRVPDRLEDAVETFGGNGAGDCALDDDRYGFTEDRVPWGAFGSGDVECRAPDERRVDPRFPGDLLELGEGEAALLPDGAPLALDGRAEVAGPLELGSPLKDEGDLAFVEVIGHGSERGVGREAGRRRRRSHNLRRAPGEATRPAAPAARFSPGASGMPHVVLLGDSIIDNGAYVSGGPDVADQLRKELPPEWKVTLAAVDGAVLDDVHRQVDRMPREATHLVLSVGGNDALRHSDLLEPTLGVDVLARLADAAQAFGARYHDVLRDVHGRGLPLLACTIYEGNLGGSMQKRAIGAIATFNDRIQRSALRLGVPVLELRDLFTEPADYANPIEPSVKGGAKLARAIAGWLTGPGGSG